jgi:hypothetical protein
MTRFLYIQLVSLRALCEATMAAIDVALALNAQPVETVAPPAEPQPEGKFNKDATKCEHPRSAWRNVPAMGNPTRVICLCGETMEDSE